METFKFREEDTNLIEFSDKNDTSEKRYMMTEEEFLEKEASEKELRALKLWLFSENVRIENEKKKLQEMQNRFLHEKVQFQNEMKVLNQRMSASQQRLKQDELFFDKKMQILKSGFAQLEEDRNAFEKKKCEEEARLKKEEAYNTRFKFSDVELLFAGVKNTLALKKRYRDLLKIYHPDNLAGDKEVVQAINKEYERLKQQL